RASAAPTRTPEAFTALSVVGSGPNPTRARVVRLVALHVENGAVQARFDVTLDPGRRVPRYAADRAGLEPEAFEGLPSFATILDDLAAFLEERPLLAQDAHLAW